MLMASVRVRSRSGMYKYITFMVVLGFEARVNVVLECPMNVECYLMSTEKSKKSGVKGTLAISFIFFYVHI